MCLRFLILFGTDVKWIFLLLLHLSLLSSASGFSSSSCFLLFLLPSSSSSSSSVRFVYRSMGEGLFIGASDQWLNHWKEWFSFPQQPLTAYRSSERGKPPQPLSTPWPNVDGPVLCRSHRQSTAAVTLWRCGHVTQKTLSHSTPFLLSTVLVPFYQDLPWALEVT